MFYNSTKKISQITWQTIFFLDHLQLCSYIGCSTPTLKSNLTFCVVCVFTLQTDEWCVHNRLFNANFGEKFT
jgi:hypothetical protein